MTRQRDSFVSLGAPLEADEGTKPKPRGALASILVIAVGGLLAMQISKLLSRRRPAGPRTPAWRR